MTPDNAGQNVLADLAALGAKASPRPWQSVSEEAGDIGLGLVYDAPPEERAIGEFKSDEDASYATLAVNHLRSLLAALADIVGCKRCYRHGVCALHDGPADQALAALGRDIAKALGAT
jgi:hypothetical protein